MPSPHIVATQLERVAIQIRARLDADRAEREVCCAGGVFFYVVIRFLHRIDLYEPLPPHSKNLGLIRTEPIVPFEKSSPDLEVIAAIVRKVEEDGGDVLPSDVRYHRLGTTYHRILINGSGLRCPCVFRMMRVLRRPVQSMISLCELACSISLMDCSGIVPAPCPVPVNCPVGCWIIWIIELPKDSVV